MNEGMPKIEQNTEENDQIEQLHDSHLDEQELTSEKIESLDFAKFFDFLKSDVFDGEKRHNVPESVAKAILDKSFAFYSEVEDPKKKQEIISNLQDLLMVEDDYAQSGIRQDYSRHLFIDKAYEYIPDVAFKYPDASKEIFAQIGGYWRVLPEVLVDVEVGLRSNKKISTHVKNLILIELQEDLKYVDPSDYETALLKNLDFRDPNKYFKTATTLEFLRTTHASRQEEDYSLSDVHDAAPKLTRILKNVIEENEGSFLLNLRAKTILDDMQSGENCFCSKIQ